MDINIEQLKQLQELAKNRETQMERLWEQTEKLKDLIINIQEEDESTFEALDSEDQDDQEDIESSKPTL